MQLVWNYTFKWFQNWKCSVSSIWNYKSGLLIFRAVAEPWISSKSAKFTRTCQIPRNSLEILPNTCQHNIFESNLGCWSCLLAVNFVTSASKFGRKNPCVPTVDHGKWAWECNRLFHRVLAIREECCVSHLQRWQSFSEQFGPQMIMPENLQNGLSSCS